MRKRPTPETDDAAQPSSLLQYETVNANFARKLERERDEARDTNKKLREVLEWIAERYDDSKPMHQVAMDAYEMSCAARAILQKE